MRVTDKERKQYLKEISSSLVCSAKDRKKFINDFNDNIDEFINSNPETSIDELKKVMGSSQEIAEEFMANASPKEIKKRISAIRILIISIVIIVLIMVIFLIAIFIDSFRAKRGHFNNTIIYSEAGSEDNLLAGDGAIYDYSETSDNTIEIIQNSQ